VLGAIVDTLATSPFVVVHTPALVPVLVVAAAVSGGAVIVMITVLSNRRAGEACDHGRSQSG
jgi:hypothetical protein